MSEEAPTAARQPNPFLQVGWKMAAAFAALGGVLLVGGLLLPGTWSATATRILPHPPARVFAVVEDLETWKEWTFWPEDVAFRREGPARGAGAARAWDDPALGQGSLRVVRSEPSSVLGYRVEVDGGDLVTEGELHLEPVPEGTRVRWSERGEVGWNPVLAWAALRLGRIQSEELDRSLIRLEAAIARADDVR